MKEIIKTNKQPLVSGWSVGTDPDNIGKDSGYPLSPTESARPAEVPSAIQERFPEYCGVAWYWCRFDCLIGGGDRLILRFGVVDYMAEVWLNGSCLGSYEGGETAFEFDVTDSIRKTGENLLAVRVINTCGKDIDGMTITNTPNRNKRLVLQSGYTINYGGILGDVTLCARKAVSVSDIFVTGDPETGKVTARLTITNTTGTAADAGITLTVREKGGTGASAAAPDPEAYLYRFDLSTANMIRQDRNHACVAAFEFLNETGDGPVFRRAVAFLPKARELDPSRLMLLNSGRFDSDYSIGCAANPGVSEWTKVWVADKKSEIDGIHDIGPSLIGAGDVHCYPTSPHDEHTYDYLMKVGTGMRPVIISEYGIGTNFNVIHEARMFEQYGADPDLCDYKWVREQSEGLKRDFSKFGFDRVYPFPETMLIESQRLGARQRTLGFNLIRANPQIAGFSMTGLLDHGMCGEGLWSYWRRWKPEMFDAISDGFSPLRFCLMTWQTNAYSGREFRVKASLATEDALSPGRYSASFRIVRDCVTVWSKDTEIVIPESMPLAVPVFDERITLDVPTGKYTLLANLNNGGSPTGEKLDFYITDTSYLNAQGTSVRVWGVNEKAAAFMTSCGVNVLPFSGETDLPVIVGNPEDHGDDAKWNSLRTAAENGHKTVFMQSRLFLDHPELTAKTGFADFRCVYTQDFLYHKEYVPMPHPIFDGLRPGMMDLDYVSTVFPHETIETEASPEPICSGFVTGSIWVEGSYRSSYSIAEWKTGRGSVILSMPYVLENIGDNPIADILLINTVKYINR